MENNISEELNLLLNHFWILKETHSQDYYRIKNKLKELREFANTKLGCDIICNSKLIKLEKIPITTDTYKIKEFDHELDYILYIILLLFLEDKGLEDQFILSNFTEYVSNILASIECSNKLDWKKYKDRKSLVDVLKYATQIGILKLKDGNDSKYADDENTEVLYENTGLSHYVIRQFKFDIFSCHTAKDFLKQEKKYLDRLNYKRNMAYRGLFFYPNVILDEIDVEVGQYIKNLRGRIGEDAERCLESEFILTKNMAFISTEAAKEKDVFPNYRKGISDIILLINSYLQTYTNYIQNDKILISKREFLELLKHVHEENSKYFSKDFRESTNTRFSEQILEYMKDYRLVKIEDDLFTFYPIVLMIKGKYIKKMENAEDENYELLALDLEDSLWEDTK